MITGSPRRLVFGVVQADDHVIQTEIINLGSGCSRGNASTGVVVAGVVLSRHIHITTDDRARERRIQRDEFGCFVCANCGRHTNGANSGET